MLPDGGITLFLMSFLIGKTEEAVLFGECFVSSARRDMLFFLATNPQLPLDILA